MKGIFEKNENKNGFKILKFKMATVDHVCDQLSNLTHWISMDKGEYLDNGEKICRFKRIFWANRYFYDICDNFIDLLHNTATAPDEESGCWWKYAGL